MLRSIVCCIWSPYFCEYQFTHMIFVCGLLSLDCYVAVTGVPKHRKDHAVIMSRFARDAMDRFWEIIHDLELKLGPDTVSRGYNCCQLESFPTIAINILLLVSGRSCYAFRHSLRTRYVHITRDLYRS